MNIKAYFWDLSDAALKETGKILGDPEHPKFAERMVRLLSRCDNPKEVFTLISRDQFIEAWPRLRKQWSRTGEAADFRDWWETVYEQLVRRDASKLPTGKPLEELREIGRVIHKARLEKGWTQADFARRARMRQPDVSAVEKGKKNLTVVTLTRLGRILGLESITVPLKRRS